MLRKQKDPDKRSDLLDFINLETVTNQLMEILKVKNQENMTIGIMPIHIQELKEYLMALDLVVDLLMETYIPEAKPLEYVLFTQPGMRFC